MNRYDVDLKRVSMSVCVCVCVCVMLSVGVMSPVGSIVGALHHKLQTQSSAPEDG